MQLLVLVLFKPKTTMDLQQFFDEKWATLWFNFVPKHNPIDWLYLGNNENLTPEMAEQYPDLSFGIYSFIGNKNATMDYVTKNYKKFGNHIHRIGMNPNLTIDFLLEHINKKDCFGWLCISSNKNITMEMIFGHPEFPWNWNGVSANPNLTMEMINKHPEIPWDWSNVSANPNLTMEMINNHPKLQWCWNRISRHPNITYEMILANPDKPWKWDSITINKNVTMDMIRNNPDKKWDWIGIGGNPNLTMDMINEFPILTPTGENVPFTYPHLTTNDEYLHGWMWSIASMNSSVTIKMINDNPDKPWDWRMVGLKRQLTIREIVENPKMHCRWAEIITSNTFAIDKQLYTSHQIKNTNLLQMHIFFNKHTDKVVLPIEYVIFDNYLLKQILQY